MIVVAAFEAVEMALCCSVAPLSDPRGRASCGHRRMVLRALREARQPQFVRAEVASQILLQAMRFRPVCARI
jgi:hypothetical protein